MPGGKLDIKIREKIIRISGRKQNGIETKRHNT
jgi:hypothetical protein